MFLLRFILVQIKVVFPINNYERKDNNECDLSLPILNLEVYSENSRTLLYYFLSSSKLVSYLILFSSAKSHFKSVTIHLRFIIKKSMYSCLQKFE